MKNLQNSLPIRVVARLDVKKPHVVKGIHLEGLRIVGAPTKLAASYQKQGIDELVFIDCVASLYQRNTVFDVIEDVAEQIRIPFTVGGGVKDIKDFDTLLSKGADKVLINTWAIREMKIVSEAAARFGSQCVVVSIEAKKVSADNWLVYIDNGRENTGIDVLAWVRQAEELGAGEIFVTSIDQDGVRKGYDIALCQHIRDIVRIPVVISGGAGRIRDIETLMKNTRPSGIALASALHFDMINVTKLKQRLHALGYTVRL